MEEQVQRTINALPLSIRAEVGSIDDENRTVELVVSTGAPVERFDWWTGKRYIEKLSLRPEHIRTGRLNSGAAPLLDSHSAYSVSDQIGVVEPESVRITSKEVRVTVRFSKRDAVSDVWRDVVDKIIRSVSVGYKVFRFEETTGKDGTIPVRTATDWEPYEVSLVSMPADAGARVRSGDNKGLTHSCVVITRAEERPMAERKTSEFVVEENPLAPPPKAPEQTRQDPPEPNDRDRGATQERQRVQGILTAVRAARLPMTFADTLIADGHSLVEAQSRVFQEMARREPDAPRSGNVAHVPMGEDPLVHVRAGIENAILHRVAPSMFKLEDIGREYRGMTLIDIARAYLNARNIRTTSMSKSDVAALALGLTTRAGLHSTSDFADLLADVANKTLRKAYDEAPQTFSRFSRQVTLPDFKPSNLVQLGEAPALLEVKEHGEFRRGSIGDAKETFRLKTYGRVFGITRQTLVNDDVDAFARISTLFGRSARNLESDLVWEQITSNPTMGDGNALFSAAHGNLQTDGDVIAIASLSRGRTAMRLQTGLDGVTLLNLNPILIMVPPSLETRAQQFVGQITPQLAANLNPFTGLLQVIAEPRLEANSSTAWYLAASPDQVDIVIYAYLDGQSGPVIEQRVGFDVDGLEIKARHDFAAKAADWRGLHKDPGEAES